MIELLRRWTRLKKMPSLGRRQRFLDYINNHDIFYVCYDEPNRTENWLRVRELIPHAIKIEGVVGFDRALKTCAKKSQKSHFLLIDGDNYLLPERFYNPVDLPNRDPQWVLSWSSKNNINGLNYGNGGIKLWPKDVALSILSHESAMGDQDPTDYCFIAQYFMMNDYFSETVVNYTPEQAFRSGFREGVKMTLSSGKQVALDKENFESDLAQQNRLRLKVWCEVGADVENGLWAILGARLGFKLNAIDGFNYRQINSYDWIEAQRKNIIRESRSQQSNAITSPRTWLIQMIEELGEELNTRFPLDLKLMTVEESHCFKQSFQNPQRAGLLTPQAIVTE